MNRSVCLTAMLACALAATGCAFHRANVTALGAEQAAYYAKLKKTLQENRSQLAAGVEEQLKADQLRRQKLLAWDRELAKAELLLQGDAHVAGDRTLFLMKLAELDLDSLEKVHALEQLDQDRLRTAMALYDGVIQATEALEKNNRVLIEYLGNGEERFILRSLDIAGVARATSALREAEEQLRGVHVRSDDEARQERERAQRLMERARDLLLKAFKK